MHLRAPRIGDAALISGFLTDKEVSEGVPGSEHLRSKADVEGFITSTIAVARAGRELHFCACLDDGKLVGMCALYGIDHIAKSAKIGYWIGKPYWGRGYGKESVDQLLSIAFESLGLDVVSAESSPLNKRSVGLLHSLGFGGVKKTVEEKESKITLSLGAQQYKHRSDTTAYKA